MTIIREGIKAKSNFRKEEKVGISINLKIIPILANKEVKAIFFIGEKFSKANILFLNSKLLFHQYFFFCFTI